MITEKKYNEHLSLLCFDKNSLDLSKKPQLKDISSFDILTTNAYHDIDFRNKIETALELFLREKVTFIPEFLIFYVGDIEEQRFIHRENFDEIVKILKLQNNLQLAPKEKKDKNKMSKKAQMLLKKRDRGRKLLAKARGQDDISLGDLVSVMGVFTQDINKVLDMTLYQFYDQYERYLKRENYMNNFEMMLVGADPKKLNLDKHWTSK